jgi:hypothetical protein
VYGHQQLPLHIQQSATTEGHHVFTLLPSNRAHLQAAVLQASPTLAAYSVFISHMDWQQNGA